MAWDENANVCAANSKDVQAQPLTRVDCVMAELIWDDNANGCGTAAQAPETTPLSESAVTLSQPLTRTECDLAGMTWNETANVCGEDSAGWVSQRSAVLIIIDKTNQRMTVLLDGIRRYDWPVSTGQPGYSTPSGTYTASSMNEIWYSRQWENAPMPHAVFFTKEGHAIHGTNEVNRLGKPASHGCVRISPQNAATVYGLVAETGLENTQIVLVGLTPGGEGKLTNSVKSRFRYRAESDFRPRRGGLFRRLFGRR